MNIDTYCFQPEAEQALHQWMFNRKTPAFLLVGPPGIGKTTLVHRIMKKIGYTLCEFNASHTPVSYTHLTLPTKRIV